MTKLTASPWVLWNLALALAALIAAVSLGLHLFLPKPKPRLTAAARIEQEQKAVAAIEQLTDNLKASLAAIERLVWTESADSVQSKAMALTSKLAKEAKVSLNAFRPQKPVVEEGLERLPFTISLEGPYPNVAQFLRKLETPENRLAVNLVQLTSADGSTDAVTGTVGIFAFREAKQPKAPVPGTTAKRPSGGA